MAEVVNPDLPYTSSSLLIGTASTRPHLGMFRSCDRLTKMSPDVK